ncbi:GNAT family N-acetyltransferase [Roseateles violae]|uniref:GNAT family N-acetyltransferase n=1 Tax=Roseateles violae TaxID=3058042 RepID=A0ABT8DMQ9_9BURK|nr:GNAT family N-acetyltransferase [Pelomonas sp. PFR6]MDN3919223.1 GNAT family N-acetyltransferase [Pelomonas sp. PFR6]
MTEDAGRRWSQELAPADAARVRDGVTAYGRALAAGGQAQDIACGLHDEQGRLIAGALGRTEFRRLFINYLWVDEELRGHGLGSELLRRLEAQALKRGCVDALIETLSDRHAELYERLGYAMMAHVHDYVPGFTRYILIKVWRPRD